jgi:hypothetical protein
MTSSCTASYPASSLRACTYCTVTTTVRTAEFE